MSPEIPHDEDHKRQRYGYREEPPQLACAGHLGAAIGERGRGEEDHAEKTLIEARFRN